MTFRRTHAPMPPLPRKAAGTRPAHTPECIAPWADKPRPKKAKRGLAGAKRSNGRAAAKAERKVGQPQSSRAIDPWKQSRRLPSSLPTRRSHCPMPFIRQRDKDKGCFVCGRPFADKPGQVQHAGHVRSRGAAGHLRFTEDNCHGECEGCNGPHGAKPHQIEAGAIARIGPERYAELCADNTPHKWQRDELIAIKHTYRAKLKELKGRAC